MRRVIVIVLLFFAAGVCRAAIHAEVKANTIVISGATPRKKVAVCGVGSTRVNGLEAPVDQGEIVEAADDGSAQITIEHPAFRSVWLVVDLATDSFTTAKPSGFDLKPLATLPAGDSTLESVIATGNYSYLFVVRAPVGAWRGTAVDGGNSDDDHTSNRRVKIRLKSFTPVGSTPPPAAVLTPTDIVFAMDPVYMTYVVGRIKEGGSGAH